MKKILLLLLLLLLPTITYAGYYDVQQNLVVKDTMTVRNDWYQRGDLIIVRSSYTVLTASCPVYIRLRDTGTIEANQYEIKNNVYITSTTQSQEGGFYFSTHTYVNGISRAKIFKIENLIYITSGTQLQNGGIYISSNAYVFGDIKASTGIAGTDNKYMLYQSSSNKLIMKSRYGESSFSSCNLLLNDISGAYIRVDSLDRINYPSRIEVDGNLYLTRYDTYTPDNNYSSVIKNFGIDSDTRGLIIKTKDNNDSYGYIQLSATGTIISSYAGYISIVLGSGAVISENTNILGNLTVQNNSYLSTFTASGYGVINGTMSINKGIYTSSINTTVDKIHITTDTKHTGNIDANGYTVLASTMGDTNAKLYGDGSSLTGIVSGGASSSFAQGVATTTIDMNGQPFIGGSSMTAIGDNFVFNSSVNVNGNLTIAGYINGGVFPSTVAPASIDDDCRVSSGNIQRQLDSLDSEVSVDTNTLQGLIDTNITDITNLEISTGTLLDKTSANATYLQKNGVASDSSKLNNQSAYYYSTRTEVYTDTNTLETNKLDKSSATLTYLQINGKASDSNLLDGLDSTAFVDLTTNQTITTGNKTFKYVVMGGSMTANGEVFTSSQIVSGAVTVGTTYYNGNIPLLVYTDNNSGVGGFEIYGSTKARARMHFANSLTGNGNTDGTIIGLTDWNNSWIDDTFFIGNKENGSVLFQTNGTNQMELDENGNLSVGKINPAQALDVDGNGIFNGYVDVSAGITNSVGTSISMNNKIITATVITTSKTIELRGGSGDAFLSSGTRSGIYEFLIEGNTFYATQMKGFCLNVSTFTTFLNVNWADQGSNTLRFCASTTTSSSALYVSSSVQVGTWLTDLNYKTFKPGDTISLQVNRVQNNTTGGTLPSEYGVKVYGYIQEPK